MINRIYNKLYIRAVDFLFFIKKLLRIKNTCFKLESGNIFKIRNIDIVGVHIYKGEGFESETRQAIMSRISNGMTVLDIGANIGYYTVQIASKVGSDGKVIAFEPNPVVLEQLKENINLNKLSNVIVVNLALSNNNGSSVFFTPEPGKEAHGSLKGNKTFITKQQFNVKTEKLDDVLSKLEIHNIDFIKMDVEGAEKGILEGSCCLLSNKHKPTIIFESAEHLCKPFGHRVIDVLVLLKSYGYVIEQFEYGMWLASPPVQEP